MIKGIDISRAQTKFNFDAAVAEGVKFIILRAGIRTGKDTFFDVNLKECLKRKIPYGLYWFFEAVNDKDFEKELAACESVVKGLKPQYPIFFDMETKKQIDKLTTKKRTEMALKFCERMNKIGLPSGIYANPSWMECYYYKGEFIGKHDIWLAHWTNSPQVASQYNYKQTMWQWGLTKIDGKQVDANVCFIDYPAKTAAWYAENGIAVETEQDSDTEQEETEETTDSDSIQIGDKVKLKSTDVRFTNGAKPFDFVFKSVYDVMQISKDGTQALIGQNKQVTGWVMVKDLVNLTPRKSTHTMPSLIKISKGDTVRVKQGATTYNGGRLASFVYHQKYTVMQVGKLDAPDYIVIGQNGVITAAVKAADLIKI